MVFHDMVEAEEYGGLGIQIPDHLKPTYDKFRDLFLSYTPEDSRYLDLHRGHLMFLRTDEAHLITGDLIRTTTFTGPATELRERVQALPLPIWSHLR